MLGPIPLGAKIAQSFGSLLFGGLLTAGVAGGALFIPALTSTGNLSATAKVPMLVPFDAYLTGTGSATVKVSGGVKYAAWCIPNPLTKLGTTYGSGAAVIAWSLQMGNNPQNASFDVSFEKSCASGTGGTVIVSNFNVASGATLTLSGSRLPPNWNGADFIKGATTTPISSTTTGRFRGFVMDIHGE